MSLATRIALNGSELHTWRRSTAAGTATAACPSPLGGQANEMRRRSRRRRLYLTAIRAQEVSSPMLLDLYMSRE
jgi:hypothetical protein